MTKPRPLFVQNLFLTLTLLNTLAASFIWGINTLFLLDAGLRNAQAFLANAFFTAGQVVFEIPTGIIADMRGRRASYLLGTLTLAASTLLYFVAWQTHAAFWAWAISSVLLGLGFTFFSGATEAWLVDALAFSGYQGELEPVFAKGQAVGGVAILIGSVAGGLVAQATDLGVPYLLRAAFLLLTFIVAFLFMKDWGFKPEKSKNLAKDVKRLFVTSYEIGLKKPSIRWVMLAAPFTSGVGIYVFYAMQPHLLALYGDPTAYSIAGLAAAIIAIAQVFGGLSAPLVRRLIPVRTVALLAGAVANVTILFLLGFSSSFWLAIIALAAFSLLFSAVGPIRQAYLNAHIPSQQRATVLSFDSLLGSAGAVVIQPALGRIADLSGYAASLVVGAAINAFTIPLAFLARREQAKAEGEPKTGPTD